MNSESNPAAASAAKHTNRLIHSKSPYLLQHAHNPVDWFPWSDEAFEKARREDKPVFVSIGYSTCHWCHVMERESFEDEEVAAAMNASWVSVKVDREERPDLDHIYMTVCQAMTGSGGWPLNVILTPDRKPFFAGTYLPKRGFAGRMGMMELAPAILDVWRTKREEVLASADGIVKFLQRSEESAPGGVIEKWALDRAAEQFAGSFDRVHGGFGDRPKFPTPHNLLFLLRYWKRAGDPRVLHMVERTLDGLRAGGIFDQVGFGFHRYATDAAWLVPHFEKMLYDQALLAMAYTEAFQATGKPDYERTAREILTYVLRDMTSSDGAFFSGEDADSEGVEGKFYTWTADEIRRVLGPDDAALVVDIFGVEERGNFADEATGDTTGTNILHLKRPLAASAAEMKISEDELRGRLESARSKLFAVREKRVRPHRDDKVLTDWNGLMIAALAKAAWAFDEPKYAEAAGRAAAFLLKHLRDSNGRLIHRWRDGEAAVSGFADDYAFLVWGLIELYEATFEPEHLAAALALNDDFLKHFHDARSGGFFQTADDAELSLVRVKQAQDGATPSANSVAALNLIRLARLTGRTDLEEKSGETLRAFSDSIVNIPTASTQFLVAADYLLGPSFEVVVAGRPDADDTKAMLDALRTRFIPGLVVLERPAGKSPAIARVAPFVEKQLPLDGHAAAYVCRNFSCQAPTTDPAKMLEALDVR